MGIEIKSTDKHKHKLDIKTVGKIRKKTYREGNKKLTEVGNKTYI